MTIEDLKFWIAHTIQPVMGIGFLRSDTAEGRAQLASAAAAEIVRTCEQHGKLTPKLRLALRLAIESHVSGADVQMGQYVAICVIGGYYAVVVASDQSNAMRAAMQTVAHRIAALN
jgi:hypothetical protein